MATLRHCLLATLLLLSGLSPIAHASDNSAALAKVLAARSAEDRARDAARHPQETLEFFRLAPGMTVVEGLPGGGWYTNILANYLGPDGVLYGVNYADRLWPMMRPDDGAWIAERTAATGEYAAEVATYTHNGIKARGFTFETVPPEINGTVDRVLMLRALHNLNRFEKQAGTRSQTLAAIHQMLKPDGLVGVEQHRAPESASAEWADGSHGYLDEAAVIVMFEEAGFELVADSEINANPLDKPVGEDTVWRLPPTFRGSENDPKQREAMLAIGESDRMTLLFRKAP